MECLYPQSRGAGLEEPIGLDQVLVKDEPSKVVQTWSSVIQASCRLQIQAAGKAGGELVDCGGLSRCRGQMQLRWRRMGQELFAEYERK